MRTLAALLFLFLSAPFAAAGAEAASTPAAALEVPDVFDPSSARKPRPGEWLEYLVAFPADPLENSLSPRPAPTAAAETAGAGGEYLAAFNPPQAWRALPLRLVMRRVGDDSCQASLTFAGETRDVTIPFSRERPAAVFHYPAPQPIDRKRLHRLNGRPLEVDMARRRGGEYGFVRLSSPDIPFGLVRFATENLDLVLVGMGDSPPPDFPLPAAEAVEPPPGALYGANDGKEAY